MDRTQEGAEGEDGNGDDHVVHKPRLKQSRCKDFILSKQLHFSPKFLENGKCCVCGWGKWCGGHVGCYPVMRHQAGISSLGTASAARIKIFFSKIANKSLEQR